MKPSLENLLQLQRLYDQLSIISELIVRVDDKLTDEDADQENVILVKEMETIVSEKMSQVLQDANVMAKKLRLHRPSKN